MVVISGGPIGLGGFDGDGGDFELEGGPFLGADEPDAGSFGGDDSGVVEGGFGGDEEVGDLPIVAGVGGVGFGAVGAVEEHVEAGFHGVSGFPPFL